MYCYCNTPPDLSIFVVIYFCAHIRLRRIDLKQQVQLLATKGNKQKSSTFSAPYVWICEGCYWVVAERECKYSFSSQRHKGEMTNPQINPKTLQFPSLGEFKLKYIMTEHLTWLEYLTSSTFTGVMWVFRPLLCKCWIYYEQRWVGLIYSSTCKLLE